MKHRGLKRSLSDFRLHPWLHILSISTISAALIIIGGFFLILRNFNGLAKKTSPQITGTLYLKDDLSTAEIEKLREKILALEDVKRVTFKSKKSVVAELQVFLGGSSNEILPGGELFPDVFEVEVKEDTPTSTISTLRSILSKLPEAVEVDFSDDWLQQYKKARQLITWIGLTLMLAIVIGCSFIITNFMGMRHEQRKNEIEIVNLIGADREFVLSPFLWEGVMEGTAGAIVALLTLWLAQYLLTSVFESQWASILHLGQWLWLSFWQSLVIILMGVGMATFGGISVYWRVQKSAAG